MRKEKRMRWSLPLILILLAGCTLPAEKNPQSGVSACGDDSSFGCEVSAVQNPETLVEDFEPMSFQDAIRLFEDDGSGLLYFGFPDCPWCREVVPILHDEAEELGVPVHYVRTRDDQKELLYTPEQRTEIAPYLREFVSAGLDGELKLYVPLVVYVRDGELVMGHQGTVDDHDAHEREMTEEERKQVDIQIREIVSLAADQMDHS